MVHRGDGLRQGGGADHQHSGLLSPHQQALWLQVILYHFNILYVERDRPLWIDFKYKIRHFPAVIPSSSALEWIMTLTLRITITKWHLLSGMVWLKSPLTRRSLSLSSTRRSPVKDLKSLLYDKFFLRWSISQSTSTSPSVY